jgi:hypothetical protein
MFTFVETHLFTRIIADYLSDEEYGDIQMKLAADPELDGVIWMLTIYAKNQAQDIAPEVLRRIKREIDE